MKYNWSRSFEVVIGKIREPYNSLHGEEARYIMYYYGNTVCVGKARYGKSAIIKHCAVEIANNAGRRIIIIDPEKKWDRSITHRNYRSPKPQVMKNLKVLDDVSLKISDITEESDWVYLGFTGAGAEKIAQLANHPELHKNNPASFLSILQDIPTRKDDVQSFNEKYKMDYAAPLFDTTYKSMIDSFYNIKDFFYNPENKEGRTWVKDWGELAKNHNLIINVNANKQFTSFVVGWIMARIEPLLESIKPLFISEEASWLFGNPDKTGMTKSAHKAITWMNRYAKRGVAMIFITQFPSDLHPDLLQSITCFIIGALNPPITYDLDTVDRFFELARRLPSDLSRGIRPFWFIDTIKNRQFIFDPLEPCCNYWS